MPKTAKELSAVEVKRLASPGMHAVGGVTGLLHRITDTGARGWVLRVRYAGKRRNYGLGGYPDVTLAQARERAREIKDSLYRGIDPIAERRAAEDARRAADAKRLTFADAARQCHAAKADEFRSEKHRRDWLTSLQTHANPSIGDIPVADIELAHILAVLKPIWQERTETATRVRQRIERVLAWATVSGYREGENPARWSGNLEMALPTPSKIQKVRHMPALPWRRVPDFMSALREREGMGARALEFAILTAARSGEVRGATWDEIDLQARTWTVPADRIKAGRAHTIPLSDDAMTLLEKLPRMAGSDLVFTAARGGPVSDMTLSGTVKRMHSASIESGGEGWIDPQSGRRVVPHGFRSSFKEWARDCTGYADEVSELALAHVNSDATRAAYARDALVEKRRRMMADWARFAREGAPQGGDVVAIREAQV